MPLTSQINLAQTILAFISRSVPILFTHLCLGLPCFFFLAFPPRFYIPSSPTCSCYMPCQSHPPSLESTVKKLLIIQFSPASCYVNSPWSKYSPPHSVLKHSQPMFLYSCQKPNFASIQTVGKIMDEK
jgi:hypothetical protein